MAEVTAVYRAIGDFSALKRQADAARRSLRRLRDESSDTHADYVAGQEEVTEATDDSTKANTKLNRVLGKVQKQTRDTTQAEGSRVDVLKDTVAQISKQSAAQRENTRLEVEANRAKEKLTLSTSKYQSVAADAASTDEDRAKALDQVRLASIAAAAATDRLQSSMARLAIGGGGRGGRPRGPGIATDVGAFGRAFATVAAGALSTLLLVVPTINTIIAGVVGLISLLGAATIAAAAFAAAFITVGAAMAFAAFKWRDLLSSSTDGVSEWKAAVLAIEAAAFDAFKGIMSTFESTSKAGTSMWDSVIDASRDLINRMEPIFQAVADAIYNFTQALAGVPGAASPFLDFLNTWLEEWKVLRDIVNEDILPGGPGFFTKYEAPAKAFVEGIARVINGIRKFSRMGLGLNMDQLAEFITNVFDALAKLVQIIPRYSNALVTVGLATSEWLDALIPIIDAAVKIGEVILKDLVAPLVTFAGWITTHILNLPIISWLASLAGGFTVAAFALSKLSFGLISFKALMTGQLIRSLITFVGLVKEFGFLQAVAGYMPGVVSGFQKLGSAVTSVGTALTGLSGLGAATVGTLAITAAVLVTWFAFNRYQAAARKRQEQLATAAEKTRKLLEAGAISISEAYAGLVKSFKTVNAPVLDPKYGRQLVATNTQAAQAARLQAEATAYATEELQKWGNEITKNSIEGVSATGALTEEQEKYLLILKDGEGTQQNYRNFLMQVNDLYDKGIISTAQYAQILDQLGVSTNSAGEEVDVMALKIEGASNTIATALIDLGKQADLTTGGLERFATAMGEDPTAFARDAVEAFNDVAGGILGTGAKVTEWFTQTADAIEAWKNELADSFDIVKQAFIDLGGEADLTWDKLKKGFDDAIESAHEMNDNINYILKHGASPLLEQLIAENGPALASLYDVLAEQGPKGIHEVNKALREGVDISTGIADSLADAMGVALEPLLKAVEVLISKMLGIPFKEVEQRVNQLVDTAEGDIERIEKRKPARFAVTTPSEIGPADNLTAAERRARRRGGRYEAPSGVTTPSELRQYPVPEVELDDKALRTKYETTGRVAVSGGMAAGIAEGTPVVKKASRDLAGATVEETNKRLGIASPSKVFVTIGKQVVAGFTEGITDPQGWNSAIGAIVSSLTGIKDTIVEMFENARTWLGGIIEAFKHLYRVVSEDLTPAVDDLQTALENLPASIFIDFDLDTSKAEAAANTFLENMEKKGLIFQTTPGGKPLVQHEGGPAGHSGRFASGRPRSDEVDARLQRGEYVFSRKSVESMGGLGEMDAFHSFLQGKRLFHNGGPVDESEEVSAKIRRLAESLGIAGVTATGVLPKQDMQPKVSVSAPGAGKVGGITAAAANYMATIKKNFPMITGYGTIAVRNIAGTSTWSQHAYGNAIDVMTGSSTALRQAVAFFSNQYRRILSIAHLLADPWFASPLGDHYNHVHADFFPQYGGTPPGQPYRAGGKVRKRGGRVHANEFVLRESAANALGTGGLDYLNTHADRYGPAAFLEAFNQSFATTAMPRMGGVGSGADGADGRAMFSIAMHLDGKTISRSVDVYSREADILLPGR